MLASARKLLEIFIAQLGSARIFLENEQLENVWLDFYFPCLKSPNTNYKYYLFIILSFSYKLLFNNQTFIHSFI